MATNPGVQDRKQGTSVVGALVVGPAGTTIKGLLSIAVALSPAQVAANTVAAKQVTVTGIKAGDLIVNVIKPTEQAGLALAGARVSADATVQLNFVNDTAAPITPTAAETYTFLVWRP